MKSKRKAICICMYRYPCTIELRNSSYVYLPYPVQMHTIQFHTLNHVYWLPLIPWPCRWWFPWVSEAWGSSAHRRWTDTRWLPREVAGRVASHCHGCQYPSEKGRRQTNNTSKRFILNIFLLGQRTPFISRCKGRFNNSDPHHMYMCTSWPKAT